MTRQRALYVFVLCCASVTSVYAQVGAKTIYKCGQTYTDQPCHGGKVIAQISTDDIARANRETDAANMLNAMRAGHTEAARTYAQANGEEAQFNWASSHFRNEVNTKQSMEYAAAARKQAQQQYQQEQQANNLQAENAALRAQHAEDEQQSEADQRRAMGMQAIQDGRRAQDQAKQQAQDMAPKFNPTSGQWCQTNGATVQCH